jgi:hypothetical protein
VRFIACPRLPFLPEFKVVRAPTPYTCRFLPDERVRTDVSRLPFLPEIEVSAMPDQRQAGDRRVALERISMRLGRCEGSQEGWGSRPALAAVFLLTSVASETGGRDGQSTSKHVTTIWQAGRCLVLALPCSAPHAKVSRCGGCSLLRLRQLPRLRPRDSQRTHVSSVLCHVRAM